MAAGAAATSGTDQGSGWRRYVPAAVWLPAYDRAWLNGDLVAALTVWALLVPEAMAYATLAGVPPEAGLYAAPLALVGYALFGTSRQLNVGPSSTVAVMSAAAVTPFAMGDADRFIELTALLALIVGAVFVVAGLLRAGVVADFMSRPVLDGFIIGLALTIAAGQLHKLFGFDVESGNFFEDIWFVLRDLDMTSGWTLVVGASSLAALFLLERFAPKVPAALTVVIAAIVAVSIFDLEAEGVEVIGEIPAGLPPLGMPDVAWGDVADLLPGALGIVLVGFAESVAAARTYASKYGYEIDADQELIALGAANLGAGFSQGFVVDGSLSKSAAADEAGARSQLYSLVLAAFVLITVLALTPLFENLPEATLGAVVIHAVWSLIRPRKLQRFWKLSPADFWPALVAMLGVLLIDILAGLALAVIVSLLLLLRNVSRPRTAELGRVEVEVDGRKVTTYRSVEEYPESERFSGLVIFRFDAELFFANANVFKESVRDAVDEADPAARVVIIDGEMMSEIDLTALDMLEELEDELDEADIELWFARIRAPVAEMLDRLSLTDERGTGRVFPSRVPRCPP
jgi:high affinity sulfate transporter 1